jgi:hypothetical protein
MINAATHIGTPSIVSPLLITCPAHQRRFAKFGWGGTAYLTGAVICLAMFFIYTAAPNEIRWAKVRTCITAPLCRVVLCWSWGGREVVATCVWRHA